MSIQNTTVVTCDKCGQTAVGENPEGWGTANIYVGQSGSQSGVYRFNYCPADFVSASSMVAEVSASISKQQEQQLKRK